MKKIHLVSFDIFDTLITRNTPKAQDIFYIVQNILSDIHKYSDIPISLRNNFAKIRILSEEFVRENLRINQKKTEVNFDDIYEFIKINYNLCDVSLNKLKELEIQTEKRNLFPVVENIQLLKEYIKQGKEIVLISDMYFPKSIVQEFLLYFDDVFTDIDIYVSSEYNLKKSDGSIFKYIKNKFNPVSWLHIGDNFKSDVFVPYINGIKTKQYKTIKLKSYEKYLLSKTKNDIRSTLLIGCSKVLRIKTKDKKYHFGCSFAAPILYNYVKWVLEQCLSREIKHLYFVSRDGYILQKIADIIIKRKNLDLITHYFYVSRLACKTVKQKNKENLLSEYLNQQIPSSERVVAFVELNGSGRTQDYISDIYNRTRNCKTYNFYLNNTVIVKQNNISKKCSMIPVVNSLEWTEYLCRSPEGQTLDYKIDDLKKIIPVKEKIDDKIWEKWGLDNYINGILDFVHKISEIEEQNDININTINHFLVLQEYIYNHLDKETADIIGSVPFSTKGNEAQINEVAPKINLLNLFFPKYTDYIAIARCNPVIKPFVKIIRKLINPRTYAFINREKDLAYLKFFGLKINIKNFIWRNK